VKEMINQNKFISKIEANKFLNSQGDEFTIIYNPDYIHPSFEIVPLALKLSPPLKVLRAVVMDMDGTITTTEKLCIHSLEFMIRKMSGKLEKDSWIGIDEKIDFPNIIGNSTTKHVEYLLTRYTKLLSSDDILKSFIYAALWTLYIGKDENRKAEVKLNLANFGLSNIHKNERLLRLTDSNSVTETELHSITDSLLGGLEMTLNLSSINEYVRIGIDIYYQRYHEILKRIEDGKGNDISRELFGNSENHLIEPMPGVVIFLSLVKGWLGEEIINIIPQLIKEYELKSNQIFAGNIDEVTNKLLTLSKYFQINPIKTAIVTSSISYEAKIVMAEMVKVARNEIPKYNLSSETENFLHNKFSNYKNLFDAFVTASDSSEIRLKPHRDLYSIALHQLGISKNIFDQVIGFEDSESGTIAIRAAGIGMCIAVPFAETSGHNLDAATFICEGGLPEALLNYNLFL